MKTTSDSHHTDHGAAGSTAGVLFQLDRALYWLAACSEKGAVCVEVDDDVSVEEPSGAIWEQDKYSLQGKGQPFQDRNINLWKTLLIWLKAARGGALEDVELHLVTNRPVPAGCLARRIAAAKTKDEVAGCIDDIRGIAADASDTLEKHSGAVVAHSDEELGLVIERVRLFDGTYGVDAGLREKTRSLLHLSPDSSQDELVQALLGWLHDTLRDLWRRNEPGRIARVDFDRQLEALRSAGRSERRRERAARLVPVSDEEKSQHRGRPFVERLIEIDVEDNEVDRALEDFLRFLSERFRMAKRGDIVKEEWEDLFDELRDRWEMIMGRHRRNAAGADAKQTGQNVYFDTTQDPDYRGTLAGVRTTHAYFTRGCYHRLADASWVHWLPMNANEKDDDDGS